MKAKIRGLLENLDLQEFLDYMDIDYNTIGKNIGQGWVGIEICPFCGADNNHFGIDMGNKSISCWVCSVDGTLVKFLMKTERISMAEAVNLIEEFLEPDVEDDVEARIKKIIVIEPPEPEKVVEEAPPEIELPGELITSDTLRRPKLAGFLRRRGIPLDQCIMHNLRYEYERSLRIIIPIKDPKGKIFAYQGRDVSGLAILPYITQPRNAPLGTTLFNFDTWDGVSIPIISEGVFDVLRLESLLSEACPETYFHPMALFSNSPTDDQLSLLAEASEIVAMFDHDSWFKAKKLQDLPVDVHIKILPKGKDPGDLTLQEFQNLDLETLL